MVSLGGCNKYMYKYMYSKQGCQGNVHVCLQRVPSSQGDWTRCTCEDKEFMLLNVSHFVGSMVYYKVAVDVAR